MAFFSKHRLGLSPGSSGASAASLDNDGDNEANPPLHPPVLGAYYPPWKVYQGRKPSDLRLDILTHVYYAFAGLKDDGTVHSLDEEADTQIPVDGTEGCLAALALLKRTKHPHLRILLSVGGGSGSQQFAGVAADAAKTRRFCQSALAIVRRYDLDGIDVDWEHPSSAAQGASFVALVRALREYMPSPRYTLTAALPAGEWCMRHVDLATLLNSSSSSSSHTTTTRRTMTTPVLDFLHVMAYDFAGPWTGGQSGHHAQLYTPQRPHNEFAKHSVADVTAYLVAKRRVDPRRVVIGVPVYGRSFTGVDGPGQTFSGHAGDAEGTFEYRDLPRPGAQELVDRAAGAASCCGGDGGWVSYDNPETVAMKARFVCKNRLAGVFFWTGSFDAEQQQQQHSDRSLAVAAHKVFINN